VWLQSFFADTCSAPPSQRHEEFWDWIDALEEGIRPEAYIAIWPRGGGKSTTVEHGCARVGQRLTRRFALYVCETQAQANLHVQAISTLFLRLGIGRAVNTYGHSKGWKIDLLRTDTGFNVAALGLDAAIRGVKLDNYRPDFIIFDDVDSRADTPATTAKKEETVKNDILAAGSTDLAVAFAQNLIHADSIAAKMADGRAEFLADRLPVKIYVAIDGLKTEPFQNEAGVTQFRITEGVATWAGQSLEICQQQIYTLGLPTFLRESQHQVEGAGGFFFDQKQIKFVDDLPSMSRLVRAWDLAGTEGGGDFTAGVLMGLIAPGRVGIEDVKHGQFHSENVRKLMKETAREDFAKFGKHTIRLKQDPGQAGKDQAAQLQKMFKELAEEINKELRLAHEEKQKDLPEAQKIPYKTVTPFLVVIKTDTGSKAVRARGYADALNSGNVEAKKAPWNRGFSEEHRKFKEDETHEYDDMVDASSDDWNLLNAQASVPFRLVKL
jgi:phage terminase large subunit-like protein